MEINLFRSINKSDILYRKDVDIMMTKQALLEHVLDMWLTQKQIDAIENGWNEFFNNPMQYKNSVVVDMVKLFLQEV